MAKVLVSLISDQTIPNIEFIKDFGQQIDAFLFITSKSMEDKGVRGWILNTCKIPAHKILEPVLVNEFSFKDIEDKLMQQVNDEDEYILNLTGGTKIMTVAVFEFFKNIKSEMYYLPGNGNKIKIHPGRKRAETPLKAPITLKEYLNGYGFDIRSHGSPLRNVKETKRILDYFLLNVNFTKETLNALDSIRKKRSKGIAGYSKTTLGQEIIQFLQDINFQPAVHDQLTSKECKYLSGDWFEEYMYFFIKDTFNIEGDFIGQGVQIRKSGPPNEFDVLVIKNNKLFLFECKTSIIGPDGKDIIAKTIYKSDSLRNNLGLFAQTHIITLTDLSKPEYKDHVDRANTYRVKLIDKNSFLNGTLMQDLRLG